MMIRQDRFYTTYGNFQRKGAALNERKHARAPRMRNPVAVGPVAPVAPIEPVAPVETGMDVGMGTDVEMKEMETEELLQMGAVPGWVAASVFEMSVEAQEEAMDGMETADEDEEAMEVDAEDEAMDEPMDDHLERARKWAFGYGFGWRLAIF